MSYRLSICIPTYNRDVYLESLLRRLFEEISGLESEVEVVVSDNASDDLTRQVAAAYADRPNFRYRRRDTNGGGERNFIEVVAAAKGEWCWLYGDDDILAPNAVRIALDALARHNPDVLFTPLPGKNVTDRILHFDSYKDVVRYFEDRPRMLLELTMITSGIFRRSVWESVPDKERFIPTRYVHALTIAQALADRGRITIIPDELISLRPHRAPLSEPRIYTQIRYLHLNYLLTLARLTGSKPLARYCRSLRRACVKGVIGQLLRHSRDSVVRGGWLTADGMRALFTRGLNLKPLRGRD